MTEERDEFDPLETALRDARRDAPQPSAGLMAKVLDDAMGVQAGFAEPMVATVRTGVIAQLFRVLGGWPSAAGLSMAGLAGLWIGISPPVALQSVTMGYLGPDTSAYLIDTSAEDVLGLVDVALVEEAM